MDTSFLFYVDDINLLGKNINIIQKDAETLLNASEEVGLKVNMENAKCIYMPHHQVTGRKDNMKTANKSYKN
jgi:hypothetical protein